MESLFNIVWALVATASVYFWLKRGRRTSKGGHFSLVGLTMLVVILFPVISVSDDLWSLQNPAETDTCQRRDHVAGCSQTHFPATAALPEPTRTELKFWFRRLDIPRLAELTATGNPAFGYIENRPPPVF
jgi:hypothetical protein